MKDIRRILARAANLVTRRYQNQRLQAEIEEHVALQTEDNIRAGMEPGEARRRALLKFGSVEAMKESYHELESIPVIENLLRDCKYGLRTLRKSPGFTAVAVATLALGIASTTTVFSLVNVTLFKPLLYRNPGQVVPVWQLWERGDFRNPGREVFLAWRDRAKSFEDVAAVVNASFDLRGNPPVRLRAAAATASFFRMLGVQPEVGRVFTEEEAHDGAHVIVLSHRTWRDNFGANPRVAGTTVVLNGVPWTVIGVMPTGFSFVRNHDVWVPMEVTAAAASAYHGSLLVVGRLRAGLTPAQAQAEMDTLQPQIARDFPQPDQFANKRALVMPLRRFLLGPAVQRVMIVLLGTVGFVLLIACANISNLLLARGAGRQREIAVRVALGAGRGRILGQLLVETLILALAGATAGLLIAAWAVSYLSTLPLLQAPGAAPVGIDATVLAFTAAITALAAAISGVVPAWQTSKASLMGSIKSASAQTVGTSRHHRLRGSMVVAEIALSVMLLAGAGLSVRSFINMMRVDPGFNPAGLLTMEISVSQHKSTHAAQFYQEALERVRTLPGVESADICTTLPLIGWNYGVGFKTKAQPKEEPQQFANLQVVTESFFRTLEFAITKGRPITAQDTATSLPVVIVNRHLAERFFNSENPIGKQLLVQMPFTDKPVAREIIGVAANVKDNSLSRPASDDIYLPFAQAPIRDEYLVVRSPHDPAALTASVRSAIASVDPDQPIEDIATMQERLDDSLSGARFSTMLMAGFAMLALALATLGIYGVITYRTAQRTAEFGVRMALGASPASLQRLVLRGGVKLVLLGCLLGLLGAVALTRALSSMIFGVGPHDPLAFGAALALIFSAALLASFIPARRATKVDPMVALRYE